MESLEFLISLRFPSFRETVGDKLLGDPLVGLLSIFAFWLLDLATGWEVYLLSEVGVGWRIVSIGILMLLSFFTIDLDLPHTKDAVCVPHVGSLLYGSLYIIVVLLIYGRYEALDNNVIVWICVVAFYAAVAGMRFTPPSTFQRVVSAQSLVLAVAAAYWLVQWLGVH